jgi:hypothetical protein
MIPTDACELMTTLTAAAAAALLYRLAAPRLRKASENHLRWKKTKMGSQEYKAGRIIMGGGGHP